MAALLVALTVAACSKYVTHEGPAQGYDSVEAVDGSYNFGDGAPAPPQPPHDDYEGTAEAWAHLDTSAPAARRRAMGVVNTYVESRKGYYGAAFYFPPGTFRGSGRAQQGKLEIMSWANDQGDAGGVRIDPADSKAYLFRKQGDGTDPPEADEPLGESFVLREGCWNWLAVHQDLSDGPGVNEVYLNGRRVVDTDAPNTYPGASVPRRVRFGLAAVDTDQEQALDAFVDYPYVSTNTLVPPMANACEERPNVLFILTDDQRIGMGGAADPTPGGTTWMPSLQKWFRHGTASADGGKRFSNAFATTPWCCPSRASIFSGRYAHNTGVRINQEARFLDQSTTLQRHLKDAGYRTGVFGKFLNGWIRQNLGNPAYLDSWSVVDGGAYYREPDRDCSSPNAGGAECVNEDGVLGPLDPGVYITDYIGARAEEFIDDAEAADRQPWFLHVAPTAPHAGRNNTFGIDEVETQYRNIQTPSVADNPATFPADVSGKPPHVIEARENALLPASDPDHFVCPEGVPAGTPQAEVYKVCIRQRRDTQFKLLKSVDDLIEGIFEKLRATGEEDNTLVVFASDNGYMWGEFWLEAKTQSYMHSVAIPMMMRWPGHVGTDLLDTRLVANIDLAPTALAATGVAAPAMDGKSLLAAAARERLLLESWGPAEFVPSLPPWAATITADYHYGENYVNQTYDRLQPNPQPNVDTFFEYYDLGADQWQLDNLFGSDGRPTADDPPTPQSQAAMSSQLAADRVCAGATCP
jgi:arylsulfatase A-like enzyme